MWPHARLPSSKRSHQGPWKESISPLYIHRNSTYNAFRYNVNAPAGFPISMTTRGGGMDRHESLYCAGKRRPPFIMPRELFTIIKTITVTKTRSYGSDNLVQARWTTNSSCMLVNPVYHGCAGRPFFAGRGKGENPWGGRKNWLIPKILQKCGKWNEKCDITYHDIIYKIDHNIIILAENKYCIRNRDYDHPFLIIILE